MLYLAQSCSPTKKRKNKKHEQEGHEGISWLLLLYSEVYSTRKKAVYKQSAHVWVQDESGCALKRSLTYVECNGN